EVRARRLDARDRGLLAGVEQVLHHHHRVVSLLDRLAVEERREAGERLVVVVDGDRDVLLAGAHLVGDLLRELGGETALWHGSSNEGRGSNLPATMARVRAINVSAVKSLHLTRVAHATVGRDGIEHDREFMLADATGRIATQRNTRMLAQISSAYDADAGELELV